MKKNGYPLLIAAMLVIVFFEALELTEDFKEKKNTIFGETLSEADAGRGRDREENKTLSDLYEEGQKEATEEASETVAENAGTEFVPVMTTVEEDYFDDAVFIGDSRMYGMMEYSGLEGAVFYTSIGLNIYDLFDKKYIPVEGSKEKIDLETALGQKQFKKVYLMVGLNELGRNTDEGFAETYRETVEHIMELQPDAIIYVHGILKVTEKKSRKDKVIKNEIIERRNLLLSEIPDGEKVFWLDINEIFCDEDGALNTEYSGDEVHLYARCYKMWVEYLKEHAYVWVEKEIKA